MRRPASAITAAIAIALAAGVGAPPAPAASKTSVQETGFTHLTEVSHTGRWIVGGGAGLNSPILDRRTGSAVDAWLPDQGTLREIVRDNPGLILETQPTVVPVLDAAGATVGHRSGPVWLTDTTTGTRTRIDTDSSGLPLEPAWVGMPEWEDPQENAYPHVIVGAESVTRSGALVAFCANYDTGKVFSLYLKDLRTGTLTKRAEACGAGGPDPGGEYVWVTAPEISYNGKVIHLRGAIYSDGLADPEAAFYPDTLVFLSRTKSTRVVKGNGSMTRDGKLLFMRIGTRKVGSADRTGGKVGVYKVSTKRTKRLPGRKAIYGTNAFVFSAFDRATWRGRYVVYGNKASVIDRKRGTVYNYGKVMRRHGFTPKKGTAFISGNGKLIFALAKSSGEYVAVDWR